VQYVWLFLTTEPMRIPIRRMLGRLSRPRVAILAIATLGLVAIGTARGAQPLASVLGLRLGGDQRHTRVVVDLQAPAHGVTPQDADPAAVVLDLQGAGVSGEMKGQGLGLVRSWTVEPRGGGARIALSLAANARIARRFLLPPGDGIKVYRYVLDLEAAPGVLPQARRAPGASWLDALTGRSSHAAPPKKLVVIDAGHGGRDPGAPGGAHQEKNLTLLAAEALKDRLERTGRYRVTLTRTSDVYIPLDTRVAIARKAGADLFISLHADSDKDHAVRGASVYTLSERGADRAAKKALVGGDWIAPGAKSDPAVDRILLDLTQRATQNRSAAFAHTLLDHLDGRTAILRRSQRDAGFAVLLAPDVPAVLLEMGFMTNPEDEAALADPERRLRLVDAIADAVDDYFAADGGATSVAALP
jgi:N-acetylmuramoyl-L-alanine amidase